MLKRQPLLARSGSRKSNRTAVTALLAAAAAALVVVTSIALSSSLLITRRPSSSRRSGSSASSNGAEAVRQEAALQIESQAQGYSWEEAVASGALGQIGDVEAAAQAVLDAAGRPYIAPKLQPLALGRDGRKKRRVKAGARGQKQKRRVTGEAGSNREAAGDGGNAGSTDATGKLGAASGERAGAITVAPYSGNLADYQLSRALLEPHAGKDGVIVWTMCNLAYLDYAQNWAEHVRRSGVTPGRYLVGAMGADTLRALLQRGIPAFAMPGEVTARELVWGSDSFRGQVKVQALIAMLELGFDSFFTDTDSIWLRNPLPYFNSFPDADVLCTTDARVSEAPPDDEVALEPGPRFGGMGGMGYADTGVCLTRPSALQAAEVWLDDLGKASPKEGMDMEQPTFNAVMFRGGVRQDLTRTDRMNRVFNGTLLMGFLSLHFFPQERMHFVERTSAPHPPGPYIVHGNFFTGHDAERHYLRDFLMWGVDPAEYFNPPEGFLLYRPNLPSALLEAAVPQECAGGVCRTNGALLLQADIKGHFALVNHQLRQVRAGLAVARALGRILILPEFWCGVDHGPHPHHGITGPVGVRMSQMPFICPTDFILQVDRLLQADPPLPFRESSFLENQQLPPSVSRSRLLLQPCQVGDMGCCGGAVPCTAEAGGTLAMQANLTDAQLRTALQGMQQVRILEAASILDVFSGHASSSDAAAFEEQTKGLTATWCCFVKDRVKKQAHEVRYDLWWDKIPHVDANGRGWEQPWMLRQHDSHDALTQA